MEYDVIVIGGGLSGLTAGSLLSKKGLKVGVIDRVITREDPVGLSNAMG